MQQWVVQEVAIVSVEVLDGDSFVVALAYCCVHVVAFHDGIPSTIDL